MTASHQRVVACVISRANRFLICQRPVHKRHGGLWEFPGGKAEEQESDERPAKRELKEELGVRLIRASPATFEIADPGSPYVIAFVPVEIDGEPSCIEHQRIVWDSPGELLKLPLAPSDEAFVRFLVTHQVSSTSA